MCRMVFSIDQGLLCRLEGCYIRVEVLGTCSGALDEGSPNFACQFSLIFPMSHVEFKGTQHAA